jgi:hypothetical protein
MMTTKYIDHWEAINMKKDSCEMVFILDMADCLFGTAQKSSDDGKKEENHGYINDRLRREYKAGSGILDDADRRNGQWRY